MWNHGEVPKELGCTILGLITKVNTDTQVIGLLELLWKVTKTIINTRLRVSVRLHDVLHGFHTGRVTGTAILELEMA